ncbi:hypothetical protein LPB140_10650 [Sphingorhabdus lutea]|uniref:Thioredoxin domain-containing protein n=2 Tax=Sphingorhabdus lutea TaxID=1913578 RepID=A0A1L3JF86_9SPHN|nr:hypothetical protein LPB140_10650 [Sphingorhabdus lutea]
MFIWSQYGKSASSSDNEDEAAIADAGISKDERAATEAIIRQYILENPEIIPEAMERLKNKQSQANLSQAGSALLKPFANGFIGPANAKITIVEFSDYNCGFCRKSVSDIEALVATNKDVKVVFRELPILAESSQQAAFWSLAAAKQGKYQQMHNLLFAVQGLDNNIIRAQAQKAGLDMAAAEAFIKSDEAKNEIAQNIGYARQIGFSGTPTFIIGDEVIEGAVGKEKLQAAIDKARKKI